MKPSWALAPERGPAILRGERASVAGNRRPAAFLDRDGTLNAAVADRDSKLPESPLRVADVRLLDGVIEPLVRLDEDGYALVCVSNQPAAAKGKVSVKELFAVHERVLELLAEHRISVAMSLLCLHHPAGVIPGLSGPCDCRKPAPGMLRRAARDLDLDLARSWMIGDTDTDVEAGAAAGSRTALVEYPPTAHKRVGDPHPDLRASCLAQAVEQLRAIER